jgi:uncharacterized protein
MANLGLTLSVMQETFAICRLEKDALIPDWALAGRFVSITRTADELSIVVPETDIPSKTRCVRGWSCLKLEGTFELSSVGILASLTGALAHEGISVLALSTFETDYLLVKAEDLAHAIRALAEAGFQVQQRQGE